MVPATASAIFEIGLVVLLAGAAGYLARRAGLPAVVGYLAVGLFVSPFTPGYVADRHQLELFADVGVVLLLFEVGIEINPLRLRRERVTLLWAAPAQVALTALASGGLAYLLGLRAGGAAAVGLIVALSSSVVVVNITRSRRRTTNKETEEAMLAWSVLQDLVGVLAAALLFSFLGSGSGSPWRLVGGLVAFILVVIGAAWILPRLLVRLRNEHDIFLLVSVASGLVLAGLGARFFGVPLALAAFVAGLAIGESPEAAEARRRILPFRDLFAVLFFVAIGSLIDPGQLGRAWPWILALLAMLIVFKVAPTYLLARLGRLAQVRPLQLAVGLGQVGEFSFVIASVAVAVGALPQPLHTAVLVTVLISIGVSSTAARLVRGRPDAQPERA